MMKAKRKTFWIVSLFVALCACILCGCAGSADASFDVRDYFNIPTYVAETACVGEQTVIAGVTATEAKAEDYTITLYNPDGEKVEKDGFLFTPTQEGRYKCVYSYRLNGEYYEYSYDIHASIKDGPVFHNEPELPYAFLAGREYTLPTVTAKDYLRTPTALT